MCILHLKTYNKLFSSYRNTSLSCCTFQDENYGGDRLQVLINNLEKISQAKNLHVITLTGQKYFNLDL